MPNKAHKPEPEPVVFSTETPVEVLNYPPTVDPVPEPIEQPKPAPIFKPVYFNVRALGWYNNGLLIDKPWMPGETRRITRELYKRIKNDLPDNWETV